MKNILLFFSLFLSAAIAVVNTYAIERFWYWEYPWVDLPMHFAGGVLIGALSLWVAGRLGRTLRAGGLFWIALAVGVAWEIFEYAVGAVAVSRDSYSLDTLIDLAMDVCGAFLPLLLSRFFYGRRS